MTASVPAGRLVAARRGPEEVATPLDLVPGLLCETLVVTGLPLDELRGGTRLRAGTALLELTEPGEGGGLRDGEDAGARAGARVVERGVARIGDAVVIEAVPVPLEDALDLHPFAPADVVEVVREYLDRARAAGFAEVRLIHGRGRGVQREAVRRVLAGCPAVLTYADAPPERGGWGATLVRLRRS
jgi:Smr domain-containing protein